MVLCKIHSTKTVRSHSLTLFDITQQNILLNNQNCSLKMKCMHNFLSFTHILSGHSLQFIIFIIKTSVLLSRVLGTKVPLLFIGATGHTLVIMTPIEIETCVKTINVKKFPLINRIVEVF